MLVTAGIHPPRNVSTAVSLRSGVGFAPLRQCSRMKLMRAGWSCCRGSMEPKCGEVGVGGGRGVVSEGCSMGRCGWEVGGVW